MGLISFAYTTPTLSGVDVPAYGFLTCSLLHRETVNGAFRTVDSFVVNLVGGVATATLSDTAAGQCWKVVEGGGLTLPQTRYVIVSGPAAYTALTDVDPATLAVVVQTFAATPDALMQQVDGNAASAFRVQADARQSATFGPVKGARPGNKCVFLGDSLTKWQDAGYSQRVSLANLAAILSNQRLRYARNAGIGGDTTAQMLARFDSDVTPYAPNVVHLLGGTNDTASTVADTLTNLASIVGKIRSIGAVPVIGTPPPKSAASTAERTRLAALAAGIKRYAENQGIPLVDYRRALVDPATGGYLTAYYNDGTHPNDAGFTLMGQLCSDTVSPILPPWSPPLANENADPNNLLANGLFLDSGATGTGRGSWTGGTGTGVASSVVTGDTTIRGSWLRWDMAASTTAMQCYQNVATAPVPGHTYLLIGKIKTAWTSGGNMFQVRNRITTAGTTDMMPLNNISVTLPDGTFYIEYVCPAAATAQQVSIMSATGTGSIQVAQMTLYDLTAMGIS
jgi:lysophospholipase L1-like esterase